MLKKQQKKTLIFCFKPARTDLYVEIRRIHGSINLFETKNCVFSIVGLENACLVEAVWVTL
jgi:hypothetical protein